MNPTVTALKPTVLMDRGKNLFVTVTAFFCSTASNDRM